MFYIFKKTRTKPTGTRQLLMEVLIDEYSISTDIIEANYKMIETSQKAEKRLCWESMRWTGCSVLLRWGSFQIVERSLVMLKPWCTALIFEGFAPLHWPWYDLTIQPFDLESDILLLHHKSFWCRSSTLFFCYWCQLYLRLYITNNKALQHLETFTIGRGLCSAQCKVMAISP